MKVYIVIYVNDPVIVRFEETGYSSLEGIGDFDLALQICLIVEDSPNTFDVELVTEDSDITGS